MNDLIPILRPGRSDPDTSSHGRTFDLTRAAAIERVPFSALELYIPGMTSSIQGFDGGINLDALALHHDKGLLCLLNPYLDMVENDFIELFCRDTLIPVATHLVTAFEAEKGLQIPLYIPLTRVPDGPANPVFFRLTTADYNRDETRLFKLNVDTIRPGGRNPTASSDQNGNLAKPVFPQHLIDFGVGSEDISTPVPVSIDFYPVREEPASTYRVARDRIRLSIGGVIVERPLNEGETESQKPVTLMVNTGIWLQLPSGSHVCEYEVVDEVGNHSDGWSPPQILELRLNDWNGPLLPEAYVEESDELGILDADALDGSDASLVILLNKSDFAQDDTLRVQVNGRTADNITVIRFYEHPVTLADRTARITWPFADIQTLIGGRAQITYERIRTGMANRLSHTVIIGIIGTTTPHLPAPQAPDAPEQVLLPDIEFLNVKVQAYLGQARNDQVVLVLVGTRANGSYYYRELIEMAGSDDEDIAFRLLNGPNGEIAQLEGGTLRLFYQVIGVEGSRTSADIVLDVGEPGTALPEPELEEAPPPDHVFDPDLPLLDLGVTVKADPAIRLHDTLTVHFEGTGLGGSFIPAPFTINEVWEGQNIPFTVPRQYVLANNNRSARVYYTVERENTRLRFSHAVLMLVGKVLDLPVAYVLQSDVTGPDTAMLNPMQVSASPTVKIRVAYENMKINDDIRLYWLGRPGLGTPEMAHLPGSATKRVEFSLPSSTVAGNLGNTVKVYYEVSRWDKTKRSGELTLQVMSFDEIPGGNPLPPLRLLETHSGLVDLNDSVTFRVDAWPFFRERERVWLTLESDNPNGSVNRLPIRVASPISSDEFRQDYLQQVISDVPAYAAWLRAVPSGREIRVVFKVAFGGGTTEADAVEFPVLTFGAVPQPRWPRSLMGYLSGQNMESTEDLHLPPWAFSTAGQQVWLTLEGQTASGEPHDLSIDAGTPITGAEAQAGLTRKIARSYFQQLGHDTTLRVTGQISLDGGVTRVDLLPLEVTFTPYFLVAANRENATEYGRFTPDAPGSFAFVMPSAQMGPTKLVWGASEDITRLNIPLVSSDGTSQTVLMKATRSQGGGYLRAFNNAVAVAGGGPTFMRLHFLLQDNTALPTGNYKGTFRAILKGWHTPSFEQDVWVQVLISK
ncbi:hypothetical protein [Pseudomonas asplenii]|uniref:hypothetical protein n=1 Tax=Pseudomonas asplenii TaxID=53407 RepID=UPI00037D366B|nr:hypothetical protein [Pseudomonas fuscovaginae]